MTDRLQQKAEAIVRKNHAHQCAGESSEWVRSVYDTEFEAIVCGLTAGIAMAAPDATRKFVRDAANQPPKYVARGRALFLEEEKDWPPILKDSAADPEIFEHIAKALNLYAALAKGETQLAGNATKQQTEERWHCDDL